MSTSPGGALDAPQPAPATRDAALAIEAAIARLLLVGTYLAIGLVLVGVVGMLLSGVDPMAHGTPPAFDLGRLPGDLVALRPEGFLWAGLVTVLGLPVGRVVVAGIGFLSARDRSLVLVSVGVVMIVIASVIAALILGG